MAAALVSELVIASATVRISSARERQCFASLMMSLCAAMAGAPSADMKWNLITSRLERILATGRPTMTRKEPLFPPSRYRWGANEGYNPMTIKLVALAAAVLLAAPVFASAQVRNEDRDSPRVEQPRQPAPPAEGPR